MNKTRIAQIPRNLLTLALVLVVVLGQGGCASRIRAYATEAEALQARGEPTTRWDNGDGTATLEYATQPEGTTCLMVQIDAEGRVLRQWDALAAKNLARVKPGMSKEDVAKLLGARRSEFVDSETKEEVWDWNIRHRGYGIATLFSVYFTGGRVEYARRARVYLEGDVARFRVYPGPYPYLYAYPYYYYPYGAPSIWMQFGPAYRGDRYRGYRYRGYRPRGGRGGGGGGRGRHRH
jgi:hypothetical protein